MKTLSLLALGAACSGFFAAGCLGPCDPAIPADGGPQPVVISASSTSAFRTPATCGAVDPSFSAGDTFDLEIVGDADMTVNPASGAVRGQPVPLDVTQGSTSTTAQSTDGSIRFTFTPSANATLDDTTPIDSVVVTVTAFPSADGYPLSAEIHLTFDDGRALDQSYGANLQTTYVPCH